MTPGYVNAHEHLTGDPLARSCIPDLLPAGASIFEWSVPLHGAHTGDDDELSASLAAAEALHYGVTTLIEAGTVAHPDRVAKAMMRAGVRGTIGTWGWDVEEGPFAAPADGGARASARGVRGMAARWTRRRVGHARRAQPGLRRAARRRRATWRATSAPA